jgi:methionine-rich copper-binding protein CopC
VLLSSLPLLAAAHGVLLESKPAARETAREVRGLMLRFNSRLEPAFSHLRLTGPSGEPVLFQAIPSAGAPNRLTAALPTLDPGIYTVHWRILTVDGHITHGNFWFQVVERR